MPMRLLAEETQEQDDEREGIEIKVGTICSELWLSWIDSELYVLYIYHEK